LTTDDGEIKEKLLALAYQYPRYGYWNLYHLMRNQGYHVNHTRIYRLYKENNLTMRRKTKKRLVAVQATPLKIPCQPNETWSIDFMTDTLTSSKRFRTLNVIDDFNREGLAIEAAASIPGLRLIILLDKIAVNRGYPKYIRCDNVLT
jgi:putative transposase